MPKFKKKKWLNSKKTYRQTDGGTEGRAGHNLQEPSTGTHAES